MRTTTRLDRNAGSVSGWELRRVSDSDASLFAGPNPCFHWHGALADSPLKGFVLALGISVFSGSSVMADGFGHADIAEGRFKRKYLGEGTLGWAEYGLYPGLYGFSLRWHPGYGYGRYALGVGADGGYPFYGGPGYPHPWPHLRRFGPATPFAYYGGPDYPRDGNSNYYSGIGGLAIEKPVVTIGEPGDMGYVGEDGYVAPVTALVRLPGLFLIPRRCSRLIRLRPRPPDHPGRKARPDR